MWGPQGPLEPVVSIVDCDNPQDVINQTAGFWTLLIVITGFSPPGMECLKKKVTFLALDLVFLPTAKVFVSA